MENNHFVRDDVCIIVSVCCAGSEAALSILENCMKQNMPTDTVKPNTTESNEVGMSVGVARGNEVGSGGQRWASELAALLSVSKTPAEVGDTHTHTHTHTHTYTQALTHEHLHCRTTVGKRGLLLSLWKHRIKDEKLKQHRCVCVCWCLQ